MNNRHAELIRAMVDYDRGDPMRIHHFLKVHDLAAAIGTLEGLDPETQFILETAAITNRQKKMGYSAAQELLTRLGLEDDLSNKT